MTQKTRAAILDKFNKLVVGGQGSALSLQNAIYKYAPIDNFEIIYGAIMLAAAGDYIGRMQRRRSGFCTDSAPARFVAATL